MSQPTDPTPEQAAAREITETERTMWRETAEFAASKGVLWPSGPITRLLDALAVSEAARHEAEQNWWAAQVALTAQAERADRMREALESEFDAAGADDDTFSRGWRAGLLRAAGVPADRVGRLGRGAHTTEARDALRAALDADREGPGATGGRG